ncbi:MAG: peroxiredoxin family protein [Hyphomicrobiaceae bacterium]
MHQETRLPELAITQWLNTPEPLSLAGLAGRPVLIHAFQMLCPGCVAHAIPQTQKAHRAFAKMGLQVIGLHTVFEHHDAMTPVALKAFVHEYGLTFPIGIDEAGVKTPLPVTMQRYDMRGTPTTILIGRDGGLIAHQFGQIDDMILGAMIGSALAGSASGLVVGDTAGENNMCSGDSCQTG